MAGLSTVNGLLFASCRPDSCSVHAYRSNEDPSARTKDEAEDGKRYKAWFISGVVVTVACRPERVAARTRGSSSSRSFGRLASLFLVAGLSTVNGLLFAACRLDSCVMHGYRSNKDPNAGNQSDAKDGKRKAWAVSDSEDDQEMRKEGRRRRPKRANW